jgi:uncharacterized damage-inducible protein DinB
MAIKDGLLPEYDHEMGTTRRVLERVPEAEFSWKPHEKSMSMGELAGHIAAIPHWCTVTIGTPELDFATAGDAATVKAPASKADMLADFDKRVTEARAALAGCGDADMMAPWTLRSGDHEIFTLPRVAALRGFVMNHLIHHRGQLSVYLRLKNIPVPPIYGPSADEQ